HMYMTEMISFFFQAEDGIRDFHVTGVQTCASSDLADRAQPVEPRMLRHLRRLGLDIVFQPLRSVGVVVRNVIDNRQQIGASWLRSEERRVGKECKSRGEPLQQKKEENTT